MQWPFPCRFIENKVKIQILTTKALLPSVGWLWVDGWVVGRCALACIYAFIFDRFALSMYAYWMDKRDLRLFRCASVLVSSPYERVYTFIWPVYMADVCRPFPNATRRKHFCCAVSIVIQFCL